MEPLLTTDDWLLRIGDAIRALRLESGIRQTDLAKQADISESALKNLESGHGATLTTLVRVLRALRRESWLDTLKPAPVINPLQIQRDGSQRQRAPRRKKANGPSPQKA